MVDVIRCVAIDDEPLALQVISKFCNRIGNIELLTYSDPLVGLDVIRQTKPHIAFLDIEMENMDGIHTALLLRDLALPVLIVYVSAHEEYLKELFCTEPFRFLSKPIERKDFREVFHSACRRIQSRSA